MDGFSTFCVVALKPRYFSLSLSLSLSFCLGVSLNRRRVFDDRDPVPPCARGNRRDAICVRSSLTSQTFSTRSFYSLDATNTLIQPTMRSTMRGKSSDESAPQGVSRYFERFSRNSGSWKPGSVENGYNVLVRGLLTRTFVRFGFTFVIVEL